MRALARLIALIASVTAFAQQPPEDPIARHVVPPELVMAHSEQIGLTDKQRAAIKAAIQQTQAKVIDVQWDLQEQTAKMTQLLQRAPIDEAGVLEQADKIMNLEREIKRAHLAMLVRIKNALTAEQIARLEMLRKK